MRKFIVVGIVSLCGIILGVTFVPSGADVNETYQQYMSAGSSYGQAVLDTGLWEQYVEFTESAEKEAVAMSFPLIVSDSQQVYVTSLPGPRNLQNTSGWHAGLDLAVGGNPADIKVVSATKGTVVLSGYRAPGTNYSGGNQVHVKTQLASGIPITVKYLHLKDAPTLEVGSEINVGDFIGVMGHSGDEGLTPKMGIHLHFEVEVGTGTASVEESLEGPRYTILNPFEERYFVYSKSSFPKKGLKLLNGGNDYPIKLE